MAQIKLNNFSGSIVFKYNNRNFRYFDRNIIKMLFPESIFINSALSSSGYYGGYCGYTGTESTSRQISYTGYSAIIEYQFNFNILEGHDKLKGTVTLSNPNMSSPLFLYSVYDNRGRYNVEFDFSKSKHPTIEFDFDYTDLTYRAIDFVYDLMDENGMFTGFEKSAIGRPVLIHAYDGVRSGCVPVLFRDYLIIENNLDLDEMIGVIAHEMGHFYDYIRVVTVADPKYLNYDYFRGNYGKLSVDQKKSVLSLETVSSLNSIYICAYLRKKYNVLLTNSAYDDDAFGEYKEHLIKAKKSINKNLPSFQDYIKAISAIRSCSTYGDRYNETISRFC